MNEEYNMHGKSLKIKHIIKHIIIIHMCVNIR